MDWEFFTRVRYKLLLFELIFTDEFVRNTVSDARLAIVDERTRTDMTSSTDSIAQFVKSNEKQNWLDQFLGASTALFFSAQVQGDACSCVCNNHGRSLFHGMSDLVHPENCSSIRSNAYGESDGKDEMNRERHSSCRSSSVFEEAFALRRRTHSRDFSWILRMRNWFSIMTSFRFTTGYADQISTNSRSVLIARHRCLQIRRDFDPHLVLSLYRSPAERLSLEKHVSFLGSRT